ncbi:MAG: Hpt domain-containing protein [Candidatus Eremiobacteraeota bacterium]|nr:Hpt domain-containing protein [Candidatus Eremiobacteraeota bacterium]
MEHPASQLDLEFLDELLDGDKEFAEELFETYHESAGASLSEARQMLVEGNADAYRPFHTLKGASASVGLMGLREIAKTFEADAKAGEYGRCQDRLAELVEAVRIGQERLRQYLESLD